MSSLRPKALRKFTAPKNGAYSANPHPLETVAPERVVGYLEDPERGPRLHWRSARAHTQAAVLAVFDLVYAIYSSHRRLEFERRVIDAATERGIKEADLVKAALAVACDYRSDAGGVPPNERKEWARERRLASNRLGRDAAAIRHLLNERCSPPAARKLIEKPGEGLDVWARRYWGRVANPPGQRAASPRQVLVATALRSCEDIVPFEPCLAHIERCDGRLVVRKVVSLESLGSRRVKEAAKAFKTAVNRRLRRNEKQKEPTGEARPQVKSDSRSKRNRKTGKRRAKS